ncbi:hypothetical protein [Nonomuraea sp. GTA35]|uniref:hypothetical protein n=1 Tax=Nonomuraea sp. GTA35 TaxID=1676746 RepID=UPI0035BF69E7
MFIIEAITQRNVFPVAANLHIPTQPYPSFHGCPDAHTAPDIISDAVSIPVAITTRRGITSPFRSRDHVLSLSAIGHDRNVATGKGMIR